jgi:hypothetical protein
MVTISPFDDPIRSPGNVVNHDATGDLMPFAMGYRAAGQLLDSIRWQGDCVEVAYEREEQ